MRTGLLVGALLAGVLGLLGPGIAGAEMVTITLEAARTALAHAQTQGRPDLVWHLARGLIAVDPKDYSAHAALAQAELQLGRPTAASAAARRAAALAHTRTQRFEAALLRARAADQAGGPQGGVIASYWARRAIELAPQDAYRTLASDELRGMKARAPLQLQFHLTLAPSSNLNNGSRETLVELPGYGGLLWELSPLSRALSGWSAEVGLSGRWRLHESATAATHLRFAGMRREVRLSAASRRAVQEWREQQLAAGFTPPAMPNYDFGVVELGLQHQRRIGRQIASLGMTVGHSWYGGHDLADYLRLDAGVEHPFDSQITLFGQVQAERQWRKQLRQDHDTLALQTGVIRALANGDRLRLGLGFRTVHAADGDLRHDGQSLQLGWEKSAPVAGIRLAATIGAERRQYDPAPLAPAGRRDLRLDANLALTLERLDHMGFVPVVNVTASRTNSNVRLRQARDLGVSVGFQSRF